MIKYNFSQREANILIFCVVLVFVFGIYRIAYIPLKDREDVLMQKIILSEKKLRNNLKMIQKSQLIEKEYKDILSQFRQSVPDEEVMSSILSEIETVANKFNIRIVDMKPQQPRVVDFYKNFSVSLAIDGELSRIIQFVHLLQSSPHTFHVNELRLNKKSPKTSILRTQLVLSRALIPLH